MEKRRSVKGGALCGVGASHPVGYTAHAGTL